MSKEPQASSDFPNSFYRVTVKGLLVQNGKVMLVHDYSGRSDTDPSPVWELPGGGADFGEGFADALKREVKEEMGLTVSWMDAKPTYVWITKREGTLGMKWYYVLTLIFRFELESLAFMPTTECREIRFFSKTELAANVADLGAQVVPLAQAFRPEDFT